MSDTPNDFVLWARCMGYHGKQLNQAQELIGYRSKKPWLTQKVDIDTTLRLAMAARRAGLPPWTPEADAQIASALPTAAKEWESTATFIIQQLLTVKQGLEEASRRLVERWSETKKETDDA